MVQPGKQAGAEGRCATPIRAIASIGKAQQALAPEQELVLPRRLAVQRRPVEQQAPQVFADHFERDGLRLGGRRGNRRTLTRAPPTSTDAPRPPAHSDKD
jgi:hypothetical protein